MPQQFCFWSQVRLSFMQSKMESSTQKPQVFMPKAFYLSQSAFLIRPDSNIRLAASIKHQAQSPNPPPQSA